MQNIIYSYDEVEECWKVLDTDIVIPMSTVNSMTDDELFDYLTDLTGQEPIYRIVYSMRRPFEKL